MAQPPQAHPPKLSLSSCKVPPSQVLGNPERGPQSHCETRAGSSPGGSYLVEWSTQHAVLQKMHRHIGSFRAP